jgi:hypothetical protein
VYALLEDPAQRLVAFQDKHAFGSAVLGFDCGGKPRGAAPDNRNVYLYFSHRQSLLSILTSACRRKEAGWNLRRSA